MANTAIVGIIMGSDSDLNVMQAAADTLNTFNIPFDFLHYHVSVYNKYYKFTFCIK